jgi:hypothetical protein
MAAMNPYAWLAGIGAKVWAWLVAIAAAIAVVFGFYRMAKEAGIQDERDKQREGELERVDREAVRKVEVAQAQAETEVETVKVAKDEASKVNGYSAGAAAAKLRDKWSRD